MGTTSVTLRIPDDILEQLPHTRGERSRALIGLLRKGLSLPNGDDKLNELEEKIKKLERYQQNEKIELMKWKEEITQRLSQVNILNEHSGQEGATSDETKTQNAKNLSLFDSPKSTTVTQKPGRQGDEIPDKAQLMTTGELRKILKKEEPSKQWLSRDIAKYRLNKKADKWHFVGLCKFKFHKESAPQKATQNKQYNFWVIYPFRKENQED